MQAKWFYPLVAGAFVISTVAGVRAADLPIKASIPTLVSYQGSQWYLLAGTVAETDRASVTAPFGGVITWS